jgi:phytanoyl-CoA hydroxylase
VKRLRSEDVERYRRDGYLAVEDVLDADLTEELRRATATLVARAGAARRSDSVFDFATTADGPRLRRIRSPERQDPSFARALVLDAVLDCVEDLIGGDIRFWSSKLNLKYAGGGQAVEWHQDWAFGPATNDDVLTVGIALDDSTLENGCLLVLPGSHRGPVLDHWRDGRFAGAVGGASFDAARAVPLELRRGGISVHHVRTLHASAPNRSGSDRRLLLYSYAAADAWPLAGPGDRATFDAKVLRGSAAVAPRLERVPVAPWPPWEEEELGADTSIFDFQDRIGASSFATGPGSRSRETDGNRTR